MTTLTEIDREQAEGAHAQEAVNGAPQADRVAIVREYADAGHRQYPQYAGRWEHPRWRLVKVSVRIRTKLGIAFERGDYTIGFRDEDTGDFVVHSLRNGVDTRLGWGVSYADGGAA